ncbi:MAG: sensor histidine kinase [Parasporobacterium sp.]|nr:sensor histidine kinase [Parasporobacterium sp.]
MKKGRKQPDKTIKQQINKLLLIVSVTVIFIVILMGLILLSVNDQYERALQSANTAAEFNKEFKETLDTGMYNHVIRPRTEHSVEELPMEELDQAENVLERLAQITSLPDNRWRAQSMLDMCSNLRSYMIEIAQTASYDQRMELLERNIRGETGLTALIETYMHDFIDDEVQELARLMGSLRLQSTILGIGSVALVAALTILILGYSVRISRRITQPIGALSEKAERFGADDFSVEPVQTGITELKSLDSNFDLMAERIRTLMQKQMEDQKSLHRAELELLLAQINPHFLYNTLDSIAILAESEREEDVVNMVTSLSTFFRNSLNDGRDIIPLKAELAQATSYLEIQQIRYSDIMTYRIDVPEDMQEIMVPKLMLQPLIENALYHGIKNKRGRGTIYITGCRDGSDILLKVQDNGAGIEPQHLEEMHRGVYLDHHRGLGLKNVSQRIRMYCGDSYGLWFDSELGEGTTVTVRLPGEGVSGIEKEETT